MIAADKIFYGGDIVTMDDSMPTAEAVSVRNGKIVAVGSYKSITDQRGPKTEMIDLQGKTLLPGFIEPHSHPLLSAVMYNQYIDISGYTYSTPQEAISMLKEKIKSTPEGDWILCFGYDPLLMVDVLAPTRVKIDEQLSAKHPIILMAQTLHHMFCNTMAFEKAGIQHDTPSPTGGEYHKDENGELNGRCTEAAAMQSILKCIPKCPDEQVNKFFKKMMNIYHLQGFTTVAETGVGFGFPTSNPYKTFREMGENPDCPIRLIAYLADFLLKPQVKTMERDKPGSNCYLSGVKILCDGSPFAGTMAITTPYYDTELTRSKLSFPEPPHYGELNYSFTSMLNTLRPFHMNDWQIVVHSNGERCIAQVLDVIQTLQTEYPRVDHRYRLEHCQQITIKQLQKAKQMGLTVTLLVDAVYFYGRALKDQIVGPSRAVRWSPAKSTQDSGIIWSLHVDTPVYPPNSMRTLKVAVTRYMKDQDGHPKKEALGEEEVVTVEQALKAMTINPAWQMFQENVLGSITVGKIADFTVLSQNPLKVPKDDIDQIQVVGTYRYGQKAKPFQLE